MVTKRVYHNGRGPIYDIRLYIYYTVYISIYMYIHTYIHYYMFFHEVATNLNVKHHQLFL